MGTKFLAAVTVIVNINFTLKMVPYGFAQAMKTYIGKPLGEN